MKKNVMTGIMAGVMAAGFASGAAAQEKAVEKAPEKVSWADSVKLSGDVRFRYQDTDEEGKDARQRWRFRGRVGVDGKVNDQVKATVRLVTNTGDPVSDNQTMDNAFDDKNAAFDRAFFTYTPVEPLSLRFGKMSQPWIAVDDLVMSADANPEGIAANGTLGCDTVNLLLHGGAFVVDERAADDETMLYTGQAAVKIGFGKKDYVMVGGSVYAYENIEDMGLQVDPAKGFGNSTQKDDEDKLLYATGYSIIEGFVEASLDLGLPVKLGAQYIVNTDADEDDTGYLGSASVKLPAGFAVGYQYRYLEKDSTLGAFAESTDFGNGTDIEGHIPYVSYDIAKNFNIKVQYAMGDKGLDNGKDIDTFKVDLACKF
jgi:hypothetical protein